MVTHGSLWSSLLSHGEGTTQPAEAHYNLFCEEGSRLLHSPSFPQKHIKRCWQRLKEKTFKSCSTAITDGDIEWQLSGRGKRIVYGVRRSEWVQSQPPPLLVWSGTSNFHFSHVKASSIIQSRVLSKCLLVMFACGCVQSTMGRGHKGSRDQ